MLAVAVLGDFNFIILKYNVSCEHILLLQPENNKCFGKFNTKYVPKIGFS